MGAMAVELETRLEMQIANARAAWAETAEIRASTSFESADVLAYSEGLAGSLTISARELARSWPGPGKLCAGRRCGIVPFSEIPRNLQVVSTSGDWKY